MSLQEDRKIRCIFYRLSFLTHLLFPLLILKIWFEWSRIAWSWGTRDLPWGTRVCLEGLRHTERTGVYLEIAEAHIVWLNLADGTGSTVSARRLFLSVSLNWYPFYDFFATWSCNFFSFTGIFASGVLILFGTLASCKALICTLIGLPVSDFPIRA